MVCVEVAAHPGEALLEARWLIAQAECEPRIQGIVAAASIEEHTTLASYLDALVALGPRIPHHTLTAESLRLSVERIMTEPSFHVHISAMQQHVHDAGGYKRVADAIITFVSASRD